MTDKFSPWSLVPNVKTKGHVMNQIQTQGRDANLVLFANDLSVQKSVLFLGVG